VHDQRALHDGHLVPGLSNRDAMSNSAMLAELRSEAKSLMALWGNVAMFWSVNADAGTIRDVRDGTLYCYLSREWLKLDKDE